MLRKRLVSGLGFLAMVGSATFAAGALDGGVDVIAHRGASAYAPENTLAAFALAAEMGADWFELDCTLTSDGEVVVIHDDTIDRTTGAEGRVADLTMAELKEYDVGSWFDPKFADERFPTLGEALDLGSARGIGVYVEIKDIDEDDALEAELLALGADGDSLLPGMRAAVMEAIEASGSRNLELTFKSIELIRERKMEGRAVIQSFSPVVCAVALAKAPEIRCELLASSEKDDPLHWTTMLRWVELLQPAGFNVHRKDFSASLVADLHAKGRTVGVWTVNGRREMRELSEAGVDAIITNRPDDALNAVGRAGH